MKVAALQMAMRLQGGASAELCANTGRCSREENRAGGGVGGGGQTKAETPNSASAWFWVRSRLGTLDRL